MLDAVGQGGLGLRVIGSKTLTPGAQGVLDAVSQVRTREACVGAGAGAATGVPM